MHAPIYKIGKFTGIFVIQCKASIDIDCEVPAADTSCWTTSLTCVAMVALFQCAGIAHIFIVEWMIRKKSVKHIVASHAVDKNQAVSGVSAKAAASREKL